MLGAPLFGYLAIGFFIGLNRLSRGTQGTLGPVVTLLGWVLLWPLILIFELLDR